MHNNSRCSVQDHNDIISPVRNSCIHTIPNGLLHDDVLPVTLEELPLRLLALTICAVFIMAVNLITNRHNSPQKTSKQAIESLAIEIGKAVDLKLDGKEVSEDDFKLTRNFYTNMVLNFELKIFPFTCTGISPECCQVTPVYWTD